MAWDVAIMQRSAHAQHEETNPIDYRYTTAVRNAQPGTCLTTW